MMIKVEIYFNSILNICYFQYNKQNTSVWTNTNYTFRSHWVFRNNMLVKDQRLLVIISKQYYLLNGTIFPQVPFITQALIVFFYTHPITVTIIVVSTSLLLNIFCFLYFVRFSHNLFPLTVFVRKYSTYFRSKLFSLVINLL